MERWVAIARKCGCGFIPQEDARSTDMTMEKAETMRFMQCTTYLQCDRENLIFAQNCGTSKSLLIRKSVAKGFANNFFSDNIAVT